MQSTRRYALGGLAAAAGSAIAGEAWPDAQVSSAPAAAGPHAGAPTSPGPAVPSVANGASEAPADEGGAAGQVDAGHDAYQRITAPVMINGQGPFHFLMDTGANASVVSLKLAQQLGIKIREGRPVHTVVGVKRQPTVTLDELTVGKRRRRRVSVVAVNIVDAGIDGILGIDWLDGERLVLDFSKEVVEFVGSVKENSQSGKVVVPARRRLGQLTIVDADLGGTVVSAMIDSGSELSLCNSAALALLDQKAIRDQGYPYERIKIDMISILGERFVGEMIYLPFLKLASLQLGNVPVVHSDNHVFTVWGLSDKPAVLLGMDILRQFRAVSLDFGRSHVRFDLNEAQI